MGVNKGFDERERAEEARHAHDEDERHLQDIREVGLDGAKEREAARHRAALPVAEKAPSELELRSQALGARIEKLRGGAPIDPARFAGQPTFAEDENVNDHPGQRHGR